MSQVALWHVNDQDQLQRVPEVPLDFEKRLENWIESSPSLLHPDLTIVGRQIELDAGRLDLLALDAQGRWVVIEIKRGVLSRDAIAQALDYASALATLDEAQLRAITNKYLQSRGTTIETLLRERDAIDSLKAQDRESALVIVGTGRAPGLARMVQYLTDRYAVPISVVSFDIFQLENGTRLMSREIHEEAQTAEAVQPRNQISPQDVMDLARDSGTGESFALIHDTATAVGLYPRTWKTSIMYASPKNRTKMLFTVWARPHEGKLRVYLGHESFEEFYGASSATLSQYLGPQEYKFFTLDDARTFCQQLRTLFDVLNATEQQTTR